MAKPTAAETSAVPVITRAVRNRERLGAAAEIESATRVFGQWHAQRYGRAGEGYSIPGIVDEKRNAGLLNGRRAEARGNGCREQARRMSREADIFATWTSLLYVLDEVDDRGGIFFLLIVSKSGLTFTAGTAERRTEWLLVCTMRPRSSSKPQMW